MGVQPRPIAPVYDVQVAVDAVLRALEGDFRDIYVGGGARLLSLLENTSPRLLDYYQRLQGKASQQTDWPKSSDAPSNVYSPLPYDGGVHGEFSREAKPRSTYQQIELSPAIKAVLAVTAAALFAVRLASKGSRPGATSLSVRQPVQSI
jgi:hypothetical protein